MSRHLHYDRLNSCGLFVGVSRQAIGVIYISVLTNKK